MMRYILSVIALFIAGAIFFWYTKPTYDSVQAIKDESAQYDSALAKAAALQQLKTQLLQRYNSYAPTDLDRIQKLLPDHVDVSTPASTASGDTGVATIGASGQKYDSVTIRFSTRGTYTDFLALMKDLEQALRVVDLVQLNL